MNQHLESNTLLQQGIEAIKAGDKRTGKKLLAQIVKVDRSNEQAWLWLTQTNISHEQKIKCLKQVLQINPANKLALEGLQKLQGKPPAQKQKPQFEPSQVSPDNHRPTTEAKSGAIIYGIIATVVVGFPVGLGLLLFAMNQEYLGRMITPNSSQPIGWILTFIFVGCISLAHFGIRRSLTLFKGNGWLGLIGLVGSLVLVFLALVIILLGPSLLLMIEMFDGSRPPF